MKRVSVSEENRLSYLVAYLHHNPIHHGFCDKYKSWKYSSYGVYLKAIGSSNIDLEYIFEWFGGQKKLLEYHEDFKVLKASDELD